MKPSIIRIALLILALIAFQPAKANAQTQGEMNREAAQAFEVADAKLNEVYKQVVAKLDDKSKEKLKVAQRAWVQYRDAQADFAADAEARGGSMAPLIYSSTRTELTHVRIDELNAILKEDE